MRSAGAQQAVQQEVEKLQVQNSAAAGLAPPKTEQGDVDARLGRDLPPTKVSQIPHPRVSLPPELPSWSTASGSPLHLVQILPFTAQQEVVPKNLAAVLF